MAENFSANDQLSAREETSNEHVSDNSPVPEDLANALRTASETPDQQDAWDRLEELAEQYQRPDEVALLYQTVLSRPLAPEVILRLGERAVRFHDEWYDDPSPLVRVLTRVLEIHPGSDWAFDRLTLLLTVGERWDELLALYDRVLAATEDPERLGQLLDEAAHVAKDFAGQPDRAIGYLQRWVALKPSDSQRVAPLERLLERQGRYRELIELWSARLPMLPSDEARTTRVRMASCWLDHLGDPAAALDVAETLLSDPEGEAQACQIIEKIGAWPTAPASVRRRALQLLKERYLLSARENDVIRVLELTLDVVHGTERADVHSEIADRWIAQGALAQAMPHAAAVVTLTPNNTHARTRLRNLAEQIPAYEQYADTLSIAAERTEDVTLAASLRIEAAQVRKERLSDEPGATELYARVLSSPGLENSVYLEVSRALSELLERTDRTADLLDVLERRAELEPSPTEQREVLGRAARLAQRMGDLPRALAAWQRRWNIAENDPEALDAIVQLLERLEQWEPLIHALRRRIEQSEDSRTRRDDLVRIAQIHSDVLGNIDAAIETWNEIENTFGTDREIVDALIELRTRAAHWSDLIALLTRVAASEQDPARRAMLFERLGHVLHREVNDPVQAVEAYRQALEADPRYDKARTGLHDLIAEPTVATVAVETLARAFATTDEWFLTLEILEPRVQHAPSDTARAEILREAATLYEHRANDPLAALHCQRRALTHHPADETIEHDLLRLAEITGMWSVAAEGLRDAVTACTDDPVRKAALHYRLGTVLETHLNDLAGALEAYTLARETRQDAIDATSAVVRVAAKMGRWDAVANAMVSFALATGKVEPALVEIIETETTTPDAWDQTTAALANELERTSALPPTTAREMYVQLARWHRDRRGDPSAAEAALIQAVSHDSDDPDTLRMLAALQRRSPGRALVSTLERLAHVTGDDPQVLKEAAEIALDILGDRDTARPVLSKLYRAAANRWLQGQDEVEEPTRWAVERWLAVMEASGEHAEALALLEDAIRLPFPPETTRTLRHRAAEIASEHLSDGARAMTIYEEILAQTPDDAKAIARLAELYERHGRLEDLLALRRRELTSSPPLERRVQLRLDLARVLGILGDRQERVNALRANLDEWTGEGRSMAELSAIFESEGNFSALTELLNEQASRLENAGDGSTAAALWTRMAEVYEQQLGDTEHALDGYQRAAKLFPTVAVLDALARLHTQRGEHTAAVDCLEQRLARTEPAERTAVVVRLAHALISARQPERAVSVLETSLQEQPAAMEVRTLLGELYRSSGAWEALARLLTEGCAYTPDPAAQLAALREAADIYQRRLGTPDIAVPILERAVDVSHGDRSTRLALADALLNAGRYDESQNVLNALLEEFGRRRPPERAAVHYQLARIARARGDDAEALAQLELAASMDLHHTGVLRLLGEVATDLGQFDRAERAYRALLLIARRQQLPQNEEAVRVSEVLFALYDIAMRRGQPERAREILESGFETTAQSDTEARRFEQLLRSGGHWDLLLRSLQNRLARTTDPTVAAEILDEMAAVLDNDLGRSEEALQARLKALTWTPGSVSLHQATRALAARLGALERYAQSLEELVSRALSEGNFAQACELLLTLGELFEHDLASPERAVEVYVRAEQTGVQLVRVWTALERLYSTLGNTKEQIRVLHCLVNADDNELDAATRTEALYRLAEILLRTEEDRATGVNVLERALDQEPQYARAAAMLADAVKAHPDDAALVALYERVARGWGDPETLLDALEHSAALPEATVELLREAVDLATSLGASARAEKLLRRAVDIARHGIAGLSEALWALTALAEHCKAAGDVRGAVQWLSEAAAVPDASEAVQYGLEAATLAAGALNDLPLAAKIYEQLLEREPTDRAVWEPLMELYRTMRETERLATLIASTVDIVDNVDDRNRLRMERARILLEHGSSEDEVAAVLQQVLDEDPGHAEAGTLLENILERAGRMDDLVELLTRRLDTARDRQDTTQIVALSLRLGALRAEEARDETIALYRSALEWAPDNRALLEALLALYGPEDDPADRADAMERLLTIETGEAAARLTMDLVALRESLSDEEGAIRALERGFRACPENPGIRERLREMYSARGDAARLAEMLVFDASVQHDDPAKAVALLREAAAIHRDRVGDIAAAVEVLRRARQIVPGDLQVLEETVAGLTKLGEWTSAIEEISSVLALGQHSPSERAELLRRRAELRKELGQMDEAVTDLEEAVSIGGVRFAPDLVEALTHTLDQAIEAGDRERERAVTMRLVDVLDQTGEHDRGCDLLERWIAREPHDKAALHMLAERRTAAEQWHGVIDAYRRLMDVEQGEGLIDTVLRLADACDRAGTPDAARAALEQVHAVFPTHTVIRTRLRELYSRVGAWQELAQLTLRDAEESTEDTTRFEQLRRAGEIFLRSANDATAAVRPLEQALQLRPNDHDTIILLADAYIASGNIGAAVSLLENAIANHRGRRSRELAALQHRMARAARAAGDRQVEIAWLNAALDSDLQNGPVASELAEVALAFGQTEIALKALKAITLMKTPGPMTKGMAFYHQGVIAYQQGDPRKAVFLVKRALAEEPGLTEAVAFLRQLGEA